MISIICNILILVLICLPLTLIYMLIKGFIYWLITGVNDILEVIE